MTGGILVINNNDHFPEDLVLAEERTSKKEAGLCKNKQETSRKTENTNEKENDNEGKKEIVIKKLDSSITAKVKIVGMSVSMGVKW